MRTNIADDRDSSGLDLQESLTATVAAYVPPLIVEKIASSREAVTSAEVTTFDGVVLFADIAGFTGLTERMDGRGPDGVEELSRLLNGYFTELIELIAAHGGMVMKFAGDALIALWRSGDASLTEVAHHAAQCALEIQKVMGQYRVTEDLLLSLKVSLGSGTVWHFTVGGAERWLSIIGGGAIEAARRGMQKASPGDVRVPCSSTNTSGADASERSAWQYVRLRTVRPLETRRADDLKVPEEALDALLPHISTGARDRLVANQASWLAEFRRVTVLFINIPEITLSPECLSDVQDVVRTIQCLFLRFEGIIDNLAEDYNGITLVGAFGLPAATHEDDAARAVRLTLAIRSELRDLGWSPSIAVTTARMFCGSIGSARRRSYSIVGDGMNRCARLMCIAADDVLCDEATYRASAKVIEFEFLREVTFRGKSNAVPVFRPLDELRSVPLSSENIAARFGIVGRERERQWLSDRLAALKNQWRSGVVIIEGEAGIGKTTLVSEVKSLAMGLGLRLLAGAGDSVERTVSYRVWRRIFSDALELNADRDERDPTDHLVEVLRHESDLVALLPLLNPVLGLQLLENEITVQMTGRPRAEATARLLSELLVRVSAGNPLVIVLEDCHWLDSASWALALDLHRNVPALLLVLVTRPLGAPVPDEWYHFRNAAGSDHVTLGPLTSNDILALIRMRLEVDRVPTEAADLILEKAGGHPFFSEEFALALRDSGNLIVEGRACRIAYGAAELRKLNFPDNVQGVVSERLDRLEPHERLTIKVASVNGQEFSLKQLRAIYPVDLDRENLDACLQRLVDREFIIPADNSRDDSAYAFKHAIIQDVAYQQLIFSQRRELHRRMADWLEQEDSGNLALLAHHWTHAAIHSKAIHYSDRAGNEAISRFANREAIGFIEQAHRLSLETKHDPGRLVLGRWQRQLGTAYFHLGQMDDCRRHLGEAVHIFGHPVPTARKLLWIGLPRAITRQILHRICGGKCSNWARTPPEYLSETVIAYILLGEAGYYSNDMPAMVFCIIHALNLAEVLGPSTRLAELYAATMLVTAGVPPRAIALKYLGLAAGMTQRFNEPLTTAYVNRLIGGYYAGVGDWKRVHEVLASAATDFFRFGDGRRAEECLTNVIYSHLHRGDYAAGFEALVQMERSSLRRQDEQTLGWTRAMHSQLILAIEGPVKAIEAIGTSATDGSDRLTIIAGLATTAATAYRLQDFGVARENAEKCLQLITESPPVSYTMLLFTSQTAEVLLGLLARAFDLGEGVADLSALARRACSAMNQFALAFPIGSPRALLWKGKWHHVHGRMEKAAKLWRRALQVAEQLEMAPDQALIHCHLAMVCGSEHFEAAAAIYRRIGAFAELAHRKSTV